MTEYDYICPICDLEIEVLCRGYSDECFIDGKKYPLICFSCASVPKNWEYDEETDDVITYDQHDPKRLHTVEEMVDDGWTQAEAKIAIKSVKAAIRKAKKKKAKRKTNK